MSVYLVTGASGAVGAHAAKHLLALGHEVVSIRHDEHPFDTASLIGIRDQITWVRGSILDERLCKRIVADYNVQAIWHMAALPLVQVATRTCTPIFQANLMGTVHLLEAVRENHWAGKDIRFIQFGTDKEYGDAGKVPYTEDMPLHGLGIYECSKAAASMAAHAYAECGFATKVLVTRCCNILAPGDLNLARVVPRAIVPALRNEAPRFYRTEYQREFIHVDDVIEALVVLDKYLCDEPVNVVHGQAFNIGSGHSRNMDEVISEVLSYFPGLKPEWIEAPPISRIEIPFQTLDATKIRNTVGWTSRIPFGSAVEKLVDWWRTNFDRLPASVKTWRAQGWHG